VRGDERLNRLDTDSREWADLAARTCAHRPQPSVSRPPSHARTYQPSVDRTMRAHRKPRSHIAGSITARRICRRSALVTARNVAEDSMPAKDSDMRARVAAPV
jgi:hypothetical protein